MTRTVLLVLGSLAVACGAPPNNGSGTGVPDAGSVDAGSPDAGPVDAGPVTLNQLQDQIFTMSCAVSSCHGSMGAPTSGDLLLVKGSSYSQLVNVPASNIIAAMTHQIRVVPGSPSESFLWVKVDGNPPMGEGVRMPNTGQVLPQSQLDMIQEWIEQGAVCIPYSCSDLGQTCGAAVSDGCGGTHDCGAACP